MVRQTVAVVRLFVTNGEVNRTLSHAPLYTGSRRLPRYQLDERTTNMDSPLGKTEAPRLKLMDRLDIDAFEWVFSTVLRVRMWTAVIFDGMNMGAMNLATVY